MTGHQVPQNTGNSSTGRPPITFAIKTNYSRLSKDKFASNAARPHRVYGASNCMQECSLKPRTLDVQSQA